MNARVNWRIGVLVAVLAAGGYISWQFGLFAQPHRAPPLVTPAPAGSWPESGGTTAGRSAPGASEAAAGDLAPGTSGAAAAGEAGEASEATAGGVAPGAAQAAAGGGGPGAVGSGGSPAAVGDGRAKETAGQADPAASGPRARRDRLNILLLGVDGWKPGEPSRSDMMLLLSLDLVRREASLLSIPRDARVEIPGRGVDKINHAHAFGGVELALQTVANAFQLPIHHWVRIDMAGMVALIDQLGPVTIDVPVQLMVEEGVTLGPGPVEMDGELALLYLRERHSDPQGDVGRTQRAGSFLMDLGRALLSEVGPADIPRFYAILRDHADTDIQLQDGLWQRALQISLDSVQRGTVQGRGRMIDGIYYYEVDWPATWQVLQRLRIHAGD